MKPMNMKVSVLIIGMVMLFTLPSQAQYNTALGVRAGGTSGVTIKHFPKTASSSTAVEGIVGFFGNGFSVTGLLERHAQAFDLVGLSWYYGPGVHLAYYNNGVPYSRYRLRDVGYEPIDELGIGINGIVGLEYRIQDNVPIAFSVDLKPFLEVTSRGDAGFALDPSIGIKIILK